MRKEVIELEVTFPKNKEAEKSFDSLGDTIEEQKQITIEFQKELIELERQLKQTSKANLPRQRKLRKEIDKRRDAIKDNRLALKQLNAERRKVKGVKAQTLATKKLNAGYFGSKTALTDVNRLTAEFALKVKAVKSIVLASVQSVVKFVRSLSFLKTALLATGIGALVVALGLVVAFWDDIIDVIKGTNRELEKQIKLGKENLEIVEAQLKTNELLEKLYEAEGKSTEKILEDRKEILKQRLQEIAAQITLLAIQKDEQTERANTLNFVERTLTALTVGFGSVRKETKKEKEALVETNKELTKLGDLAIQVATAISNIDKPKGKDKDKERTGTREEVTPLEASLAQDQEITNIATEIAQAKASEAGFIINQIKEEFRQEDIAAQKAYNDLLVKQEKDKFSLIAQLGQQAARLAGEDTAVGKALAVVSTTISTYLAAQQAYASQFLPIPTPSSPIRAALAASVAIASGLANVKSILSVQVPGGDSVSGGVGINASVPQIQAPQFNIVGDTGINQLAASIAQQQNIPMKTFVVAKDVTTQQELDRNTVSTATFGT